jgi:hypothetical protein
MDDKDKPKTKTYRIFGILFLFCVLLYLAISYPSLFAYRPSTFCLRVEYDAYQIAAAMSAYFSVPEHRDSIPTQNEIEKLVDIKNPWKLTKCGNNFYIHVVDRGGKCPAEIQNNDPNWNAGIYTSNFKR